MLSALLGSHICIDDPILSCLVVQPMMHALHPSVSRHAPGAHPSLVRERLHQPCRDPGLERGYVDLAGGAQVGGVHEQDDGKGRAADGPSHRAL